MLLWERSATRRINRLSIDRRLLTKLNILIKNTGEAPAIYIYRKLCQDLYIRIV